MIEGFSTPKSAGIGKNITQIRLPFILKNKSCSLRPTGYGMVFLAMVAALLIGSVNHNNNLGFLLTFLLGGIMAVSLFPAFRNLNGITISQPAPPAVFAGRDSNFPLLLTSEDQVKTGISVVNFQTPSSPIDLDPGQPTRVSISLPPQRRGILQIESVSICSTFPLGLFSLQVISNTPVTIPIYPAPHKCVPVTENENDSGRENSRINRQGETEFSELVQYRHGDDIRRVHWKSLARGKELHTVKFEEIQAGGVVFSLALLPGDNLERKLSQLCHMILHAELTSMEYGLRLGTIYVHKGKGLAHRNKCLLTLAGYTV